MTQNKRLRILREIIQERKKTNQPIGWRTIQKRYNLKSHQAKAIAQEVLDFLQLNIDNSPTYHIHPPKVKIERKNDLSVFVLCSDWHIGEIVNKEEVEVNEYNLEIAFSRGIAYLEETVKSLNQLKPKEINLVFLGDLVSGIIHQELENQTNILDQLSLTVYLGSLFIKTLKPNVIVGCYGNHGEVRTNGSKRKSKNLQNNFDLISYQMMELLTKKKIVYSKSPFVFFETKIGNCFAAHGDHILSWNGVPHYSIFRKQIFTHNLCKTKNIPLPTATFFAHFHEPQALSQYGEKVFVNGTMMGVNEFAFRKGLLNQASQMIVFSNGNSFGQFVVNLQNVERREIPKEIFNLGLLDIEVSTNPS